MLCIFRRGVSTSRCVKRFKERSMLRYNRRWFGAFKLGCLGCTFGKVFLLDLLWMLLCKLCCRAVETAFGNDLSRSTPSLLSESEYVLLQCRHFQYLLYLLVHDTTCCYYQLEQGTTYNNSFQLFFHACNSVDMSLSLADGHTSYRHISRLS